MLAVGRSAISARMVERRLERRRRDAAAVPARVPRSRPRRQAESQWQALVHDDLVESRLTAMTEVVRSLDAAAPVRGLRGAREIVLGDEQAAQWIGVLNDARLAVGTALGRHRRVGLRRARPRRARASSMHALLRAG